MKTVMITGAAGLVGAALREHLRAHYRLVLLDRVAITPLTDGETAVQCDIRDATALLAAMQDVDAVVHLAGEPTETGWDAIREANIEGCYQTVEAARQAGVRRFVFASSNHAIGYHPRTETLDPDCTTRPDTRYGLSKVFGEALLSLYADKFGLTSVCLRIGTLLTPDAPRELRHLSTWVSHRDLAQLVRCSIEADIQYEIAWGVSANTRTWWRDRSAERLGYHPQDNAEVFAAQFGEIDAAADNPVALAHQGGVFCAWERDR